LGDSVYVIKDGECEAVREQNGEEQFLATLRRGCAGRPARSRWCKSTAMKE